MQKITRKEAWNLYHKEQARKRAEEEFENKLKDIRNTLNAIEEAQILMLIEEMLKDHRFITAVYRCRNFHVTYGEWMSACGVDGRLLKNTKTWGWYKTKRVIYGVREELGIVRKQRKRITIDL